jgi:hypothetical protein
MKPIARRDVMTGGAALAVAAAVPVAAAVAPDPIFAAIAAHKALSKKVDQLYDKIDLAESEASKTFGRRPFELSGWTDREWRLQQPGADRERIEAEHQEAMRREREAEQAAKDWDKRTGIAPLRREYEQTRRTREAAARRLSKTKATTVAGAAALVEYVRRDISPDFDIEWHEVALKTAVTSLAQLNGRVA